MPLFMDVHVVADGVSLDDVVAAHRKDLEVQERYGVSYERYWVDEGAGRIFCLAQAPSAEAAVAVHREAHGLVADEIFEVREGD
jgi:hypothetical protein